MPTTRQIVPAVVLTAAFLLAQPPPKLVAARSGLAEFQSLCREEGERLWGVSLCGRLLLVDLKSRMSVATARDPEAKFEEMDGLFLGKLPPDLLIANTSVRWGSDQWAMVVLPLPNDQFSRLRLLAHESFHRIQSALNLSSSDTPSGHLDTESGRLWLRLELRALSQALRLDGDAARAAARDALLFRATRRQLNVGAASRESALEIQEGLAEYTGTVIALGTTGESVSRVARSVEASEDQPAFSRSFAYATGPALGLLLDRYGGAWRKKLRQDSDIASLLGQALAFRANTDLVNRAGSRAQRYGFRAVAADEGARAARTQALLADYRARFVDGPILQFPKTEDLRRSFNPNNLVPLGESGTVYPTGIFVSRWGKLQIDDVGGLLSPDNQSLRVSCPSNPQARPLVGPGWRLELAPGWTIGPGARSGDFQVIPE
jgi:hypothetical protein